MDQIRKNQYILSKPSASVVLQSIYSGLLWQVPEMQLSSLIDYRYIHVI